MMSAASCVVTVAAQRSAIVDTGSLPLSIRLGNAIISYVAYIGKTLWPAKLAIFYPHPQQSLPWSDVIAAAVILAAITGAVLYCHRARYLLMGWLFFVITLVPVIGIVQVGRQAMADHYTYVPCIGLFIIIAWGVSDLVCVTGMPRVVALAAALCLVSGLAVATNRYLSYWENGVKLFTQASIIAGRPDPAIEAALGDSFVVDGRYDEAYQHYAQACLLRSADDVCRYNMAEILFHRHQLRDALEQYEIAQSLTHSRDMTLQCLINSGEILVDLGDYESAQIKLAAALQIDPTNSNALRLRERALHQRSSEKR